MNAHDGASQSGVEPAVTVHVTAQTWRQSMSDDFDHAAERVACLAGGVDLGDHRGAGDRVQAADRVGVYGTAIRRPRQRSGRHRDAADRNHVAQDLCSDGLCEEPPGQLAHGHPGGRLPSACPLQNGSRVVVAILLHPGQVRVPGPGPRQRLATRLPREVALRHGIRRHDRFPLRTFSVRDRDRDRSAKRAAVPDAAGDLDLVLLELHPRTPAVTGPAACQRDGDVRGGYLDAGGHSLADGHQGPAMGLPGG